MGGGGTHSFGPIGLGKLGSMYPAAGAILEIWFCAEEKSIALRIVLRRSRVWLQ